MAASCVQCNAPAGSIMRSNLFSSFPRRAVFYKVCWLVMLQIRVDKKCFQLGAQCFAFNVDQYFSLFVTQNVFIRRVIGQLHKADFFFVCYQLLSWSRSFSHLVETEIPFWCSPQPARWIRVISQPYTAYKFNPLTEFTKIRAAVCNANISTFTSPY